MTAKTHGYITKEIELEQIYQFVLKYFDPEAKVNRYENRFGESNEMAVYFTYKGEERRLFTMVYKSRKFSKNGEKNRLVFLDLDYWGHSVEIMRSILSYFSDWLDENDCDKEEAPAAMLLLMYRDTSEIVTAAALSEDSSVTLKPIFVPFRALTSRSESLSTV